MKQIILSKGNNYGILQLERSYKVLILNFPNLRNKKPNFTREQIEEVRDC